MSSTALSLSTTPPPTPPADSAVRAFWRWQIAGWCLYGISMYVAAAPELPAFDAFVNKSVNTAIGFGLSLGLRSIYLRLRARGLQLAPLLAILAGCCLVTGVAWSVLANSAYWWYRGVDFVSMPLASYFGWTLMHAYVLLAWCAIYVSAQLHDDLQRLRALELARHAQALIDSRGVEAAAAEAPDAVAAAPLVVRSDGGIVRVPQSEIVCIEAARNYSCIVCESRVHVVRSPLATLEGRLEAARFLRVHRSTIVAVDRLRSIRALPGNDAIATLAGGREVRVSRRFRADVESALQRH
jgi:hypothetical protein